MTLFEIISVLITLAALFSYLNYRYVRLPQTIGVMVIALVMSLGAVVLGELGVPSIRNHAAALLAHIDFDQALMHGMLAFLLFAGAMHLNIADLRREKGAILLLATAGVAVSTLLVGGGMWLALSALGRHPSATYCLLFGALISPTDPIAVMGILRTANVPESLEIQVTGESLFNDGIGVVVFLVVLEATSGGNASLGSVLTLLVRQALGGAGIGLAVGYLIYRLLLRVDQYQVEILLTLALAMGGYALAERLHVSAPIAIVVAGLLIGNSGREWAMSEETRRHLDSFWELVDSTLNAVLFVLIGLQVLVMPLGRRELFIALIAIPISLLARWGSVAGVVGLMRSRRSFSRGVVVILTWGGLRGGISVALALSLPSSPTRDIIVSTTYAVVLFSIMVQGMTIGRVARRFSEPRKPPVPPAPAPDVAA